MLGAQGPGRGQTVSDARGNEAGPEQPRCKDWGVRADSKLAGAMNPR